MRLGRISIKVFTKILLGLRENFEKILVYFAEIILTVSKKNFENVYMQSQKFRGDFGKILIKLRK